MPRRCWICAETCLEIQAMAMGLERWLLMACAPFPTVSEMSTTVTAPLSSASAIWISMASGA